MNGNNIRFYEFGEFRLDVRRRILIQNGNRIPLSAKVFELLYLMVQNEGQILEHDELLDKVWEGMFVEQSNLKKNISALRHILGEKPNESFYIKTVPRRGYSFVANVRAIREETETAIYREIETEVVIEEIIETEPLTENAKLLPAVKSGSHFDRIKSYKIPVILAVLFILGVAGFFIIRNLPAKPSLNYSIENVRAKRLTNEGNLGNSAPISPDGNYLVYPVYQGAQGSLWLKQIQTGSLARLTPLMKAQYWAYDYSPDGNYVYYIINVQDEPSQSGLYRIPTLGGTPQKIIDRANGGLSFAPDGNRFAFTRVTEDNPAELEIVTAKADGSDLRKAMIVAGNRFLWSVKWSPDNTNLLCAFRERSDNKNFGYAVEIPWNGDPDQPSEKIVVPREENQTIINAAWIPDKTSLILSLREPNADICQLWQYFPASGEKRRVTNDNNSYRFINLTRDGKNLSTVQEAYQAETWVADSQTLDFQPVANVKGLSSLFWTKDGKLVYDALEDSRNTISLTTADGALKQEITKGNDGIYLYPNISQDGNSVTFLSNRSGSSQIWRIALDSQNPQQLTNSEAVGLNSKLLSDGQTLLFMMNYPSIGWTLYKQTANGNVTQLTRSDTSLWSVSPDEKFLALELQDEKTRKYRVFVQNLENGEVLKAFDLSPARQLSWSRDGKALVYISPKQDADEIVLQPVDGSASKVISSVRGLRIKSFDWSFDGKQLAVVRSKFTTDAFLIKALEN